jgi:predicted RNA-binding protein with PUA-like domain
MARWLIKNEPDCYPFEKLVEEGQTEWDGVTNALAQKHMRAMKPGDIAFYYHTGNVKAIVGICKVTSGPTPVPENEKLVTVTVKPDRSLKHPVTLSQIKADDQFSDWELVRNSRLSVMPCPAELWKAILEISKSDGK